MYHFPESTTGRYVPGARGRTITKANIALAIKAETVKADQPAERNIYAFCSAPQPRHVARLSRLMSAMGY
mgnify:CR=1 FL=1